MQTRTGKHWKGSDEEGGTASSEVFSLVSGLLTAVVVS